jgi:hypothetical protein
LREIKEELILDNATIQRTALKRAIDNTLTIIIKNQRLFFGVGL